MPDSLDHLYKSILAARNLDPAKSRTARLFQDGIQKMAKKLVEEAVEVSLDAVHGDRRKVILESADLLYNLTVIWAEAGIKPSEVTDELKRREKLLGIAEKLPKRIQRREANGKTEKTGKSGKSEKFDSGKRIAGSV